MRAVEGHEPDADDVDGDGDDSFLVDGADDPEDEDATSRDESANGLPDDGWYKSEAYTLVSRAGSETLPGNQRLSVPLWVLHYFRDVEMAVVFAQVLYWFGRTKDRKRRAIRRDRQGRTVVDKTHRQLADELGIPNERRVENCLKFFAKKEKKTKAKENRANTKGIGGKDGKVDERIKLLDYRTTGVGKGRTTRIWLIPEGILEAYKIGCRRLEEVQKS